MTTICPLQLKFQSISFFLCLIKYDFGVNIENIIQLAVFGEKSNKNWCPISSLIIVVLRNF